MLQILSILTIGKVPSRHLALLSKKRSGDEPVENESGDGSALPIVDHDPVAAYVHQLISCYSHLANFYYDRYVDCGLWRISLVFCCIALIFIDLAAQY